MGNEPIEEEIPIEFEDLYIDVQEALSIYNKLRDEWDAMSGVYVGKSYSGITEIFSMLGLPKEDWKTVYDIIGIIDKHRKKLINAKIKKN